MDSNISDQRSYDGYAGDESGSASIMEQLDLQYYLRILRKHKWPISLFTAAVTALAFYYAFTATPIYSATSTLLIESQKGGGDLVDFQELVGLDTENQDYYQTQYELLRSRGLAVRVINHLDLWDHNELSPAAKTKQAQSDAARRSVLGEKPTGFAALVAKGKSLIGLEGVSTRPEMAELPNGEGLIDLDMPVVSAEIVDAESEFTEEDVLDGDISIRPTAPQQSIELSGDRQYVVQSFMSRLTVSPVRKTKLVKISFASADPRFASLVANTVGEQYIRSYLDAKLELTTKASDWLNERLGSLKEILDESEDRLVAFKQANGLVDVDGSVGRLNEQELLLVSAELAQARSDMSGKADLYREVQALRGQPDLLQSIPSVQADPLVQNVKIQQGQVQRQLDELRNRYGERHPRVKDATSQLASLDTTLDGHINRVVGSISKDYQLAQQRVASIERKLQSGKQEIQAIGTKKFELDELSREVETNRAIYDEFFSRISEAKSADGLETANARISDEAVPPTRPFKPKKQMIVTLAALAALVLSMLMAFLYEQLDDTVKSTGDIEGKLGQKLLGILPLIKGGLLSKRNSLPLNPTKIVDKKGTFFEAVNTARTAICMDDGKHGSQVITVTSSVPGEGKSTTSINLAFSLAQIERVLLIDCDMRRPTIARAAELDRNTPGLTNLITQSAPAHECIKRGVFNGYVDILPSGPLPEHPLELLSSKRFEKILEKLRHHYDRIVIDSAPTQAVSDALVLSRLSDSMVYCVKSHETSMELVKRGIQRLRQVNAPITGVVITQVDVDKIVSYGGDYYYQGYYDYYGYKEKSSGRNTDGGKLRLTPEELLKIRADDSEVHLDLNVDSSREDHLNRAHTHRQVSDVDEFDLTSQMEQAFADDMRSNIPDSTSGTAKSVRRTSSSKLDIL